MIEIIVIPKVHFIKRVSTMIKFLLVVICTTSQSKHSFRFVKVKFLLLLNNLKVNREVSSNQFINHKNVHISFFVLF